MEKEMINRLKIVLAEEQKSSKWLAEQLGKDRATVSKWVTNTMQDRKSTRLNSSHP